MGEKTTNVDSRNPKVTYGNMNYESPEKVNNGDEVYVHWDANSEFIRDYVEKAKAAGQVIEVAVEGPVKDIIKKERRDTKKQVPTVESTENAENKPKRGRPKKVTFEETPEVENEGR